MSIDTIHIANQYPQQGDTLLTKIINLPQQINVNVDAPQLPDSIGATTYMSVKDSTFVDSVYSALRDSMQVFHKSLIQMADAVDSLSAHVTQIFDNGIGYPDSVQIWAMPIFIALIAMAMPLLIQHVNGLDGKYSATKISDTFKRSFEYCFFWCMFVVTLILFIIWVIIFMSHPGKHLTLEIILVSSASLFLLSVVILIIKLLIFSSPEKLEWLCEELLKCGKK